MKRSPEKNLKVIGRCKQDTCSRLKRGARLFIKDKHPRVTQPISQYPKDAITYYENEGYTAPLWILKLAGQENRYA